MINGHGDDIHNQNKKILSNYSSNIYSKHDFSELHAYLYSCIPLIHSYPEPDAISLVERLAKIKETSTSQILVTNGAVEAIYLLAHTFHGYESTIVVPTFSEYEDACTIHGHHIQYIKELKSLIKDKKEIVWICNPNNPTGKIYPKFLLKNLIKNNPEKYFILDQSYESFTDMQDIFEAKDVLDLENLILIHSMTKTYAIPGLRLGYILSNANMIEKIKQNSMPWSINQLAIEAGKYLISQSNPNIDLDAYLSETTRLMTKISNINGLTVLPSQMHFFLCRFDNKRATDLKQYLIDNYGILIRDASNFRGLDDHYFRLATQSYDENNTLIKAIEEWI